MEKKPEEMIPVARPFLKKEEVRAAQKVILSGWVTQGPCVAEFERIFARFAGSRYACAVSNCTTALHLALLAVGVKPGNLVITVSSSFIATANAIRYCGAEPVFVDIDLDTYNMSSESLAGFLKRDCQARKDKLFYKHRFWMKEAGYLHPQEEREFGRVAAILTVHQLGMPCNLKAILSLAVKAKLPVIEDAACAVGSKIRTGHRWEEIGRPHGQIACFSFHPRKIITMGEGGMLTTNNIRYDRQFRLLRQHGMSVSDRLRHEAKQIIFEEYITMGYNYRLTDIQAAIGIEQLKKIPALVKRRREIAARYQEELSGIDWLILPQEPAYCRTNWQSFQVRVKKGAPLGRDALMQYLLDKGVATRRGVMNSHQELPYRNYRWNLPNSVQAADSGLILPLFAALTDRQQEKVISLLRGLK